MQPKLLIIIQNLKIGGAEKVALNLINNSIFQRSFSITILSYTTPEFTNISNRVSVISGNFKRSTNILHKTINFFHKIFYTRKVIKEGEFDIILSIMLTGNVLSILAKTAQIPVIISEHNIRSRNSTIFIGQVLAKFLYRRARAMISVSEGVRKDWNRILSHPNHTVIYNPIDIEKIRQLSQEPLPDWINFKYILGVGRLVAAKGFNHLITAFHLLKNEETKLIILGEGEMKSKLQKQIRELGLDAQVYILDFDDNPYKYYRNSACYVLSSFHEGFSMTVAEALVCKSNIVSYNCRSGPAEVLKNGAFGRLVPPENSVELAKTIAQALEYPIQFDHHTLNIHLSQFAIDEIATQYKNILYNCIK